jgi:hypothetical protein
MSGRWSGQLARLSIRPSNGATRRVLANSAWASRAFASAAATRPSAAATSSARAGASTAARSATASSSSAWARTIAR